MSKAGGRKQGCQPAHRMSWPAARRRARVISGNQQAGRQAGARCRCAAFGTRSGHRWRALSGLGRPVVDKLLLQLLRAASRHMTLHFGGSEDCRRLMPRRATRGNLPSTKPSRQLALGRLGGRGPWADPRCRSHHCLNAVRGAAAEVVAQVETGHGEPGGKTQSSGRGPSLARQLGCGHAHAATAAMDWSEESSP